MSPQRFKAVAVGGKGPCGLTVTVKGSPCPGGCPALELYAVDAKGIVHVTSVTAPGEVEIAASPMRVPA